METFMIEFDLPEEMDGNFASLIPAQRLKVNELIMNGRIQMYALSADRSQLWCLVRAKDELDAMDVISEFPLISYIHPNIKPLMFYNSQSELFPSISLN